MRRGLPVLLLGVVVIGCGPSAPNQPLDPSLSTVTIEVKNMT